MNNNTDNLANPEFIKAAESVAAVNDITNRNKYYSEFLKAVFAVPITLTGNNKRDIIVVKKENGETGIFAFTDMQKAGNWIKASPKFSAEYLAVNGKTLSETAFKAKIDVIVVNPGSPSYCVFTRSEMQIMAEGAVIASASAPVLEVESDVKAEIRPSAAAPGDGLKALVLSVGENNFEVEAIYFFDIAFGMGEMHPAAGIIFRQNMRPEKAESIMMDLMTKAQPFIPADKYFDFMDITISKWRGQVESEIKPALKK